MELDCELIAGDGFMFSIGGRASKIAPVVTLSFAMTN
jgi:hypothetical protein